MKSEHAIAQQEQRNSANVEIFELGVQGPGSQTTPQLSRAGTPIQTKKQNKKSFRENIDFLI